MPRYNLVIKSETFVKLYRIAVAKNKSLGKLLNEIIEDYVEKHYPMLFAEKQEKK